jgi:tetratricopeptide (TPR) repeat protein
MTGAAADASELLDEAAELYAALYVTEPITWTMGMGYAERGERSRPAVDAKMELAFALVHTGRRDEAEEFVAQARCSNPGRGPRTSANILWARGDTEGAEAYYRRVHLSNVWNNVSAARPGAFAYEEALYGRCLARNGKREEAEEHLLAGHARALEWGGPRSRHVVEIAGWLEDLYDEWGKAELAARWRANGPASLYTGER